MMKKKKALHPVDREAMQRAITICQRRDKASRDQIDHMLRDDPWHEVGEFASFSAQSFSLGLKPWMTPPCWVADIDAALQLPRGDQRGEREAAELLQKLLAAGLSRYEPSPLDPLDDRGRPRSHDLAQRRRA